VVGIHTLAEPTEEYRDTSGIDFDVSLDDEEFQPLPTDQAIHEIRKSPCCTPPRPLRCGANG
jgi:hypothetical protein